MMMMVVLVLVDHDNEDALGRSAFRQAIPSFMFAK